MEEEKKIKKENTKKAIKITIIVISVIILIISIIFGSVYCTRIRNEETHDDLENYYNYMYAIRKDERTYFFVKKQKKIFFV